MEPKQGVVTIFPATVRIPCDIWGCRSGQMASHFMGRPENPKNVLVNLCPTCLEQLKGSVAAMLQDDELGAPDAVINEDDSVTILNPELPQEALQELSGDLDIATDEPDTIDVLEIDGKLITDFTVRELKELCQDEKIPGYSDKNKEELIDLITAHFEKSED